MARHLRYPVGAFVPVPKPPPQPDAPTTGGSLALPPQRQVRYDILGLVALPPPPPPPPSAGGGAVQPRRVLRYQLAAYGAPPIVLPPPPPPPAKGPSALAVASRQLPRFTLYSNPARRA